jgi:hypothetical protein
VSESSENVTGVVQRSRKRKERGRNMFLHQNYCKIQFFSLSISFAKNSAPVTDFMPYQDQTGLNSSPNRKTLQITLFPIYFSGPKPRVLHRSKEPARVLVKTLLFMFVFVPSLLLLGTCIHVCRWLAFCSVNPFSWSELFKVQTFKQTHYQRNWELGIPQV